MAQKFRTGNLIRLALLIQLCVPAFSQAPTPWRFWGVADGLPEPDTNSIETDNRGIGWARHGMPELTRLDGYGVVQIPDAQSDGRTETSPDGAVWVRLGRRLRKYDGSGWKQFNLPEIPGTPMKSTQSKDVNAFAALSNGRLLILLADRVVEFDSRTQRTSILKLAGLTVLKNFNTFRRGRTGSVWIAGEHGLAQIIDPPDGGSLAWREFSAPPGVDNLANPQEGAHGEVFVAAMRARKHVLLHLVGSSWTVICTGKDRRLHGWRGADGDVWVGDGIRIYRIGDPARETAVRTEALAGDIENAWQEENGTFWIATSQGLARYAPPLWRTDPDVRDAELDDLVNAICEDRAGGIWFLSSRYLVRHTDSSWKRWPLPTGFKPERVITNALAVLPNSRIAIATSKPWILIFDPVSGTFARIPHPQQRAVRTFGTRANGDLMVEMVDESNKQGFSIDIFDGRAFRPWLDLGKQPGFWDVRAMCETSTGELWLGAPNGLGIYRNGKFERLGENQRSRLFEMDGAFTIRETAGGHVLVGGRKQLQEFDGKRWTSLAKGLDRVRGLARGPDGTVWMASGTGIIRLKNGVVFANEDEDGLPSSVIYNVLADRQGRIWAGTTRGISQFHPEADKDAPRTTIREDSNSRSVAPGEKVRILFSAIDKWKQTDARRLLFSYRLDGGVWSPFGPSNVARYPSLPSAHHRFEVRAMDRNGNIDPERSSVEFAVLSPWYRTPGFLSLIGPTAVILLFLLWSAWRHHQRIEFESRHDPLTRLLNRRAFQTALDRALADATAKKSGIAVLLLDLDRFKAINDDFGHAAGDRLLQEIATRMTSCLGRQDILARLGGDEFAVVVRGANVRASAELIAARLIQSMRPPFRVNGKELTSSVSVGISLFPEQARDAQKLQKLADTAMYYCKAHHKGDFCLYEPRMEGGDSFAHISALLDECLEQGWFTLAYQPIQAVDGTCFAFEALIRMRHTKAENPGPAQFIPVAEKSGLMVKLGRWVLNESCRQIAEWRADGHSHLRVSVNVSPVELAQPAFADGILDTLRRHGLAGDALMVEITETAVVTNWTHVRSQLVALRDGGVIIALDDFGTGYSSLSSLHMLPLDMVKLDRSFTRLPGGGVKGDELLNGIVELARQMGFLVVAEGIETAEERFMLLEAGCDFLQGFLFGHPLPPAQCDTASARELALHQT